MIPFFKYGNDKKIACIKLFSESTGFACGLSFKLFADQICQTK